MDGIWCARKSNHHERPVDFLRGDIVVDIDLSADCIENEIKGTCIRFEIFWIFHSDEFISTHCKGLSASSDRRSTFIRKPAIHSMA